MKTPNIVLLFLVLLIAFTSTFLMYPVPSYNPVATIENSPVIDIDLSMVLNTLNKTPITIIAN